MFGGFKTGDQGVGHIILRSVDPEATMRFFAVLGVTGSSDYLLKLTDGTPVRIPFLKCNNREHSVALMFGPMPKRANHLMVEYQDMRDLGQTLDKVHKHGIDIAVQLGVHSNDGALSFYAANPSGWLWEPVGVGYAHRLSRSTFAVTFLGMTSIKRNTSVALIFAAKIDTNLLTSSGSEFQGIRSLRIEVRRLLWVKK